LLDEHAPFWVHFRFGASPTPGPLLSRVGFFGNITTPGVHFGLFLPDPIGPDNRSNTKAEGTMLIHFDFNQSGQSFTLY